MVVGGIRAYGSPDLGNLITCANLGCHCRVRNTIRSIAEIRIARTFIEATRPFQMKISIASAETSSTLSAS